MLGASKLALMVNPVAGGGSNERGIFMGGYPSTGPTNVIEYITINSAGNATDFGDLTFARNGLGACSNATNERGVAGGGDNSYANLIDYVTINATGNATDFGDLTASVTGEHAGFSNDTNERGIFAGKSGMNIDYVTINSAGNATDFGDTSSAQDSSTGLSNRENERGIFQIGTYQTVGDTLEYITINSTGNTTDFGDLIIAKSSMDGTSN